jgi:hypothetical protein
MGNSAKPLPPAVTDEFALKSARLADATDKPRILGMELKTPSSNDGSDTVNPDTLAVRRTFRDSAQAFSAYKRLKTQNVERNRKNQLIQKKLNNEPPYAQKKLESMGQNWRSNRPTGFISTMVSRIQPPFRQVVEASQTLTYSKYPGQGVDAEQKTKVFREEITKCIRAWRGADDLTAQIVHENTTFGFTALTWDDVRDWKPEFLRQDYTFFSVETPQEVDATPLWGRKRRYQIAELLPVLEDPEISALAGWHIENLVTAINSATPLGRSLNTDEDARRYEDWIREGSYGASYESDAKYVELGELLIKEPNGKISRYLFDDKSGDEICTQLDRYNQMSECLALFAIEIGSGSLMSSRGAGRDLYNTHIAVDKARNLVVDNVYLKGMLLLKKGPTAKAGVPPLTVSHPVAYISEGYEVIPQAMPADVEDFLNLDQFISGLAEIQVGTFLPGEAIGRSTRQKTASEVNRVAAIEGQIREGILMRFMKQYSKAVERMQRGICHPEHVKAAAELKTLLDMVKQQIPNATWAKKEVIDAFERSGIDIPTFLVPFEVAPHLDEEAISCCLAMLDRNLPPSDIILMAFTSASELLPDTLAQEEAVLDLLIQRYTGNPAINQEELMKLDWSRKVGESIANSVILPRDQVEALAIEATRQQIIELQSIVSGEEVPVSPRDNDVIHIKTMTEKLMPLIAKIPPGSLPQELSDPIMKAVQHFVQHVDQAEKKGADKKFIAEMKAQVKAAMDHLTKGKAAPVNPNVMPAAAAGAMPMPRGRRPSINQTEVAQQAADAVDPSFMGVINQAASPPNPPTAA